MSNVISTRVSDEVLSMIDHLANGRERSRSWIAGRLLEKAAKDAISFDAFVQEGLDAADSGDVISQSEMEAWFEKRIADRGLAVAAE